MNLDATLTTWGSETPWYGSVGGYDSNTPIPSYQSQPAMAAQLTRAKGSSTSRNIPDVAADAVLAEVHKDGGWGGFDGTSWSAPLWAGFMALVNEHAAKNQYQPVGFANPAIYAVGTGANYGSAFHDIQAPTDLNVKGIGGNFSAQTGFDLLTGWGSPQCGLIALLANTQQMPPSCPTGQLCSGVCADTQTDPHNCGVCGFDCGGGLRTDIQNLCNAGVCQPFMVKSIAGASRVAATSASVYVSTLPSSYGASDGKLLSTSPDGTADWTTVASNQGIINNLVQVGLTTYWSTFGTASAKNSFNADGTVMAYSSTAPTTTPTSLSAGPSLGQIGNVAYAKKNIFFPLHALAGNQVDYTQGSLMSVPGWTDSGFSSANPQTQVTVASGIDLLAAVDINGYLYGATLNNHSAEMISEALVCGGANSAWVSKYYQSVLDAVESSGTPFSGGAIYYDYANANWEAVVQLQSGQSPVSLATSGMDIGIYWLDDPQPALPAITENAGSLKWTNSTNGWTIETLASGLNRPQNLVIDSYGDIFWSEAPRSDAAPGTIKVMYYNMDTRPIITLASTGTAKVISGIAVKGQYLYWTDDVNDGEVMKVAIPWWAGTKVDATLVATLIPPSYQDIGVSDSYFYLLRSGTVEKRSMDAPNVAVGTPIGSGLAAIDYLDDVPSPTLIAASNLDRKIYFDVENNSSDYGFYPSDNASGFPNHVDTVTAIAAMAGTDPSVLRVFIKVLDPNGFGIIWLREGTHTRGVTGIAWDDNWYGNWKYTQGLFSKGGYLMDFAEYYQNQMRQWTPPLTPPYENYQIEDIYPFTTHGFSIGGSVVRPLAPDAVDYSKGKSTYYAIDSYYDSTAKSTIQYLVQLADANVKF